MDDVFRMPVDRAFTVKGTGTVVTGTVWSGAISREAAVTVFPPGTRSRVRGIQHHSAPVKTAGPGERIALALSDLEVGEIRRGSVVVTSASWKPTSTLEADVTLLDPDFVLTTRTRLRFHLGTSDVGARISRIESSGAEEAGKRARRRIMKKSELLRAIREEIQRHNLDTFMSADKIVQTGCSTCQKHFGTVEQFKFHLCDDVLPPLLDRLSKSDR